MSSARSNSLADAIVAYLYKLKPAYLIWLKDQSDESKKPSFEGRHFYGITQKTEDDSAVTQVAKQDTNLMSKIADLIKEQEDAALTIEKDTDVFGLVREMDKEIDNLQAVIKYLSDQMMDSASWNNFWKEMVSLNAIEKKKVQFEVLSGLVSVIVNEEIKKQQYAKRMASIKPTQVAVPQTSDETKLQEKKEPQKSDEEKLQEKKESLKKALNFLRARHGGITREMLSEVLVDASPQQELSENEKKLKEKREKKERKESVAAKKAVEKENILIHHVLQTLRDRKKSAREGLTKEEKKLREFNVTLAELNLLEEDTVKALFLNVDSEVKKIIKKDASALLKIISELSNSKFLPLTDKYFDETSREADRRGSTEEFIEVPPELLQEVSRIAVALLNGLRSVCRTIEKEINQSNQDDEIFFSKKQMLIQAYIIAVVSYLDNKMPEKQSASLRDVLSFFNLLATNFRQLALPKEGVAPVFGMLPLPIWEENINWQTAIGVICINELKEAAIGNFNVPKLSFLRVFDSSRDSGSARGSNRSQSSRSTPIAILIEDVQEDTSTAPKPSEATATIAAPKLVEESAPKSFAPSRKPSDDISGDELYQRRKQEFLESHRQRSPLPVRKGKLKTHSPTGSGLWKDSTSSEQKNSDVAEQTPNASEKKSL